MKMRGLAHFQTGVELIAFRPEHLAEITPPVLNDAELAAFLRCYRAGGPAFTLREAGGCLGSAGLLLAGRRARAWAVLSDGLRARPLLLHRTVARLLPALQESHGLQEIEASVRAGFSGAERWLARLGFDRAEELPGYLGTTETYVRYLRT